MRFSCNTVSKGYTFPYAISVHYLRFPFYTVKTGGVFLLCYRIHEQQWLGFPFPVPFAGYVFQQSQTFDFETC